MSPRKVAKKADAPAKLSAEVKPEKVQAAKAEVKPARPSRAKAKKVEAQEPVAIVPEPIPAPVEPVKTRGRKPKAAVPIVEAPTPVQVKAAAPVAAPAPSASEIDGHVATVLSAIRQGRAIELIFLDAETNPPRTFEARQLIFDVFTQAWFIWGWDRRYNAERHHRVDALAEVNLVDGPGRAAQGPFAEGTPANQIGGWRGGEPIPVKAQLQKQWVFAVRQAPAAFPDFKLEEGEDGKASVSFTATDLRAIARWVMQFGDGITVLEPQRLVDRVRQVAQAWGAKVAPTPAPKPEPVKEEPRHRPASRSESRSEARSEARSEVRSEPKPEPAHRHRERDREREREREPEAPSKNPRIEIRLDRL